MSGISFFCVPQKEYNIDLRDKLNERLNSLAESMTLDNEESLSGYYELSEIFNFYVNSDLKLKDESYQIRQDFTVTYKDPDFELNFPDFFDRIKDDKMFDILNGWNFSISSMSSHIGSQKIMLMFAKETLKVTGGNLIADHVSEDFLTHYADKIKVLEKGGILYFIGEDVISELIENDHLNFIT